MPCVNTEKLIDLAYGEASPNEVAALDAHVANCDACRRQWEEIAGNIELLDHATGQAPPIPGTDPARIFAVVTRREGARTRRWRRVAVWATAAMVLLATATVAVRRVEIHSTHLVIRWSDSPPSDTVPSNSSHDLAKFRAELAETRTRLEDHGRRLQDLDRLAALVVSELKEDDVQLTRASAALHLRIDALQRQNDRRWQAVGRGFHDWYLAQATDSPVDEPTTFSPHAAGDLP